MIIINGFYCVNLWGKTVLENMHYIHVQEKDIHEFRGLIGSHSSICSEPLVIVFSL